MDFNDTDFPGKNKKVGLLGVPIGFGAGKKGSELGTTAIRLANIRGNYLTEHIKELGYEVTDYGDVEVFKPNYIAEANVNPKYLQEMIVTSKNSASAM
jgi:arginase